MWSTFFLVSQNARKFEMSFIVSRIKILKIRSHDFFLLLFERQIDDKFVVKRNEKSYVIYFTVDNYYDVQFEFLKTCSLRIVFRLQ